jgi:PKD repeat protein
MRLQTKLGCRAFALAGALVFVSPAAAAPAARTLEPSRTLRPRLLTGPAPSSGRRASGPRTLPLRVPDPTAYVAAKVTAKRRYQNWRQHHAQKLEDTSAQSLSTDSLTSSGPDPLTSSGPSPRAGLIEGFNQAGLIGNKANTEGTPPDTTGAIGPSDYIELVNSELAIYSRASLETPLKTEGEDAFTGSTGTCDGQIRWDQQAGRWEYASLDCGETFGYSFGWSKNADPVNGGWCKYHESTGAVLFDYPKLGGDDNYLLIGANKFEITSTEEKYLGSNLLVIPKPLPGVEACPPAPAVTEFSVPVFTPVPANVFGASTAGYAVAAEEPTKRNPSPNHLKLFTVTKPLATPVVSESSVEVPTYTVPAGVPQPGTEDELDSSDTRLTQAVAAEEPLSHEIAIWTQHTVATSLFGPSIVQWFELKPGSSTPMQTGTIQAPEGNFAFNAAISPTTAGDSAVIHYNVAGPAMLVQLRAQSHVPGVPAGTTAGEVTLAQSSAIDKDFSCPSAKIVPEASACRWGDYAGASPDPINPEAVWGSGQFNGLASLGYGAQWMTENFVLTADTPPVASFSASPPSPAPGEPVNFNGSGSGDIDGTIVSYTWSFGDGSSPQTSTSATVSHTYASSGRYTVTLTVTDDKGLTGSTHSELPVDAPPVPSFVVSSPSPTATAPVGFDGTASKDPDGTVTDYSWSFGDGAAASGPTTSHTYVSPGEYTVTLTVTDNGGKTASVSHTITVAEPAGTPSGGSSGTSTSGSSTSSSTVIERTVIVTSPLALGSPSNVVIVKAVRLNRKRGRAILTLLVPGPGALTVRGALLGRGGKQHAKAPIRTVSIRTARDGAFVVQIVPTAAGRALLNRAHRLMVRVLIVFTPVGGTQRTFAVRVRLAKSARRRAHG